MKGGALEFHRRANSIRFSSFRLSYLVISTNETNDKISDRGYKIR